MSYDAAREPKAFWEGIDTLNPELLAIVEAKF